ncbi:regulatory iron-sulfur-containing complex subunit RicT [Mailhella massiliensis]|uniref:PSP1 domain-containing protein n=1 Tax=Mailhella massiliensis TaxID=1903261 RepID=UPI0026F2231E|nr:regulatory iron-sulfur-containing complex subunit RicT [Mailhella massiliensis]
MKQTIGIRFSRYGQVLACLYDAGGDSPLAVGESAMVMTERGLNCGRVVWQRPWQEELEQALKAANAAVQNMNGNAEPEENGEDTAQTPMPSARRASEEEQRAAQDNALLSREAYLFCRRCIAERRLDMKLVDVEILFDRSKMVFFFTAPTRIDFRDLVKDLVRQYRTRIELRQIGVRHETQMLGALGNCGMVCCCRRYLHKFAPVTIKMAKEQNLFLNPAKISGICGRLLCCLSYEQENYDAFHRSCPRLGKRYQTTQGPMRVLRGNMFRNSVVVLPDGGQEVEMSLEDWQALKPSRSEGPASPSGKEQKAQPSGGMMVFSTAPDTLDDDLADLEIGEAPAPAAPHEPSMMNSEEAAHRRKRPHHHQENHERKGRPRPAREQKEQPAPEVAREQDADAR